MEKKEPNMEHLSNFFREKLEKLSQTLLHHQKNKQKPILDPDEFLKFLNENDPSLVEFFMMFFNSFNSSYNEKTIKTSKLKTVVLFYYLASLKNRDITALKTAIGTYAVRNGLSVNAIDTFSKMGLTSSYTTIFNMIKEVENQHYGSVRHYLQNNIRNVFIVNVDDYHDCHQTRMPTMTSTDKICHMATTLINSSSLLAIPYLSPNNNHSPYWNNGLINSQLLKYSFSEIMSEMSNSYNVCKPLWRNKVPDILTLSEKSLIDSLTIHSYNISLEIHHKRNFGNTKLVDFKESKLKNSEEYLSVFAHFIK
jgi:hypothetical protein